MAMVLGAASKHSGSSLTQMPDAPPGRSAAELCAAASPACAYSGSRCTRRGRCYFIDCAFPAEKVGIEFDGRAKYGDDSRSIHSSLSRERERQRHLEAEGCYHHPCRLARSWARLRRAGTGRRSARGSLQRAWGETIESAEQRGIAPCESSNGVSPA